MSRKTLIVLALAWLLAWFAGLDHRKLVMADESRYGEIAREMAVSGDWITPRLNGLKYFEKPPLQYWATAAAYRLFGVNEWTTRLWNALAGLGGLLLVWHAANRAWGRPAGACAAAVLGSAFLYVALGHFVTLDMGVSLFMSLAVLGFMLAQMDGTGAGLRRRWMLAAWSAMALAVLSKGLIGLVLPAGAVAVYVLWQRDWGLLRRMHWGAGLAVFFALGAPWFIAVSQANPEFARFFFIHEHFERFLTKQHGRYEPAWYFLPVLALGILPWLASAAVALWQAPRAAETTRLRPRRFLFAWCATVFVFFSASGSKLPSYILPLFPALAMLVGAQLAGASRRLLVFQALLAAAAGATLAAFAARTAWYESGSRLPGELLAAYGPWLVGAGVALAAPGLLAALLAFRRQRAASIVVLAAGGLLGAQLALTGHETLAPEFSAYHVIEQARPKLDRDAPFYAVNLYDHTIPFYLGRTVTMVGYRDEMGPSIAWEPHKFLPDLESFVAAWQRDAQAQAVLSPRDLEALRPRIPFEVLASSRRYVIVRKP